VLAERKLTLEETTPFLFTDWTTVDFECFDYVEFTRDHDRPFSDTSDRAETVGTIQGPSYVTDRAIAAGRAEPDRLIVHYFQPHRPFVHGLVEEDRDMTIAEERPYETIADGGLNHETLYSMYLDNLRVALDSIENLLKNLDAEKVVITADHGELLGELGQYGHFLGVPHPALRKVPWVETSAADHGTRQPDADPEITRHSDVQDQLESLGYI
jgi:arylsulfatase A-like enzyme